jgi:hypothetical protein
MTLASAGRAGLTPSLPLRVLISVPRPDGRVYYIAALRACVPGAQSSGNGAVHLAKGT